MLTPRLINRIKDEVPSSDGFYLSTTFDEFINAAKYLKGNLHATDEDVINMLHGIYDAMTDECAEA